MVTLVMEAFSASGETMGLLCIWRFIRFLEYLLTLSKSPISLLPLS